MRVEREAAGVLVRDRSIDRIDIPSHPKTRTLASTVASPRSQHPEQGSRQPAGRLNQSINQSIMEDELLTEELQAQVAAAKQVVFKVRTRIGLCWYTGLACIVT